MNLFYGNNDWPGNNTVFWRPNDDDTKSGLPKIWRVIVKDTDFGLGLYGKQNNYNMIDLLYHPQNHSSDAWAFTEPATRLLKNMLENTDIRNLFIDKCCVFMGDFMNGKGTGETIDLIKEEAMEEFEQLLPAHCQPVEPRHTCCADHQQGEQERRSDQLQRCPDVWQRVRRQILQESRHHPEWYRSRRRQGHCRLEGYWCYQQGI